MRRKLAIEAKRRREIQAHQRGFHLGVVRNSYTAVVSLSIEQSLRKAVGGNKTGDENQRYHFALISLFVP